MKRIIFAAFASPRSVPVRRKIAYYVNRKIGFRLAMVPKPSSVLLAALGFEGALFSAEAI